MAKKDYDLFLKLFLIGDTTVGKTALWTRFLKDEYTDRSTTTIGPDLQLKREEIGGKKVDLQVWDTAGVEKFSSIATPFHRGDYGILAVYDITQPETFKNLLDKWLPKEQQHGGEDVVTMVVGNKCDLEDQRQVPAARGQAVAEQLGARFLEVSAKDNVNVDQAFMDLARDVLETMPKRRTEKRGVCVSSQETGGSKKCCCWCGQ